ncbi:glycoside hydrolase family 31 protein [Myriangium duriaei CBS 260.36]|uniref:alpha-glucosidase n=1 Tax=Myriangium duriaei CBS 260.36 TaxID=1168546 RepID=A0A9P4J355_9PEZI|nr:glycoside hydrolase family 31 protein [Myriangium duriaei CBS 260.36]
MADQDPLAVPNFIRAEDFFKTVPSFQQPDQVKSVQGSDTTDPKDRLRYAVDITLQAAGRPDTHCFVQFVTPQIWRVRYNASFTNVDQYPDENTRTIVEQKFSGLVDHLKEEFRDSTARNKGLNNNIDNGSWHTTFQKKSSGHWILTSFNSPSKTNATGRQNTSLHIFAKPFRLVATRSLSPQSLNQNELQNVGLTGPVERIIWQTSSNTFAFSTDSRTTAINNNVFFMEKPGPAQYIGFGEQGGKTLLKEPTMMNYFCYDNYNYSKVYGPGKDSGALNAKEPLYHSSPFYLEMNNTPGFANVTGFMVDNYSQVAIDLGKTNANRIAIGTRFGTFDAYILTADLVPNMIWYQQYTSIVGRPKLKPRFILGHHQGCYGYQSKEDVTSVLEGYRNSQIPLDGMHLDVDFQDRYRTFTASPTIFSANGISNFKDYMAYLRSQGLKCCANTTPILTLNESVSDPYSALRNFWDEKDKLNPATNFLVPDQRFVDDLKDKSTKNLLYFFYDGGSPVRTDPNNLDIRPQYSDFSTNPPGVKSDQYNFAENYNSGYPFHGGVNYGLPRGTPGYYPDLNREIGRKVWGEQYAYLIDNGLEFIWQDMTTPAAGQFPSRLLMSADSYDQDPKVRPPTKPAIELWSLYSYNLHKATYHGLDRLASRKNKRNFIIGRGSQTGMHRFAGLWTGDNGSSWDFWRITVPQVLALGYSGVTIAGVDMGGFTRDPAAGNQPSPWWCDPELLIRWYTGACLLPWYRNHYMRHGSIMNGPNTKEFQEPWQYTSVPEKYQVPPSQYGLYRSVEVICKYYVQLRYSLMQLLYDSMFANLTTGLPIARSMLITDPYDAYLLNNGARFVDDQYLLGQNLLVCPVFHESYQSRAVYLPQTDEWYPSNLRINLQGFGPDPILKHAANLEDPSPGGSTLEYFCPIPDATQSLDQIPYVTPMYIRAGAIIPQLDVRQYIGAPDTTINPPTFHIYPGYKYTDYNAYFDDGVSSDSAPAWLPQYQHASKYDESHVSNGASKTNGARSTNGSTVTNGVHGRNGTASTNGINGTLPAGGAQSKFKQLKLTQSYYESTRTISLSHPWDNYDPSPQIGDTYRLAIWIAKSQAPTNGSKVNFSFVDQANKSVTDPGLTGQYDAGRGVLVVIVPTKLIPKEGEGHERLMIEVTGL